MASFRSIYTQIQVHGPHDKGIPLDRNAFPRLLTPRLSAWLGKIGDPQVGPTYLGGYGIASLISGFIAIEIIGLNFWASVHWNPVAFIRGMAWHRLDPPGPGAGLNSTAPMPDVVM